MSASDRACLSFSWGDVYDHPAANPSAGIKKAPVLLPPPDCQRVTTDDYESLEFVCILVVTLVVVAAGSGRAACVIGVWYHALPSDK